MRERDGVLGLPMIRNQKTVDPSDKSSPAVYQIETAMGAAIEVFEGARALRVPRTRFAPVKTTDDLLALRSDAYGLTDDARVVLAWPDQRPVRHARLRPLQAAARLRGALPEGPAFAGRVPSASRSRATCASARVWSCAARSTSVARTRSRDGAVLEG